MNSMYDIALQNFLEGKFNWATDTNIKVALVGSGYTFSSAHTSFATSVASHQVGTSQTLATNSDSGATASGGTATFSGIASGVTVNAIVVYWGGTGTPLIAYYDSGTGLPLTTTGADVKVEWNGSDPTGSMFSI